MTVKRTTPGKPYWENKEELAAATAQFDREFIADDFGDSPPEARARLRRSNAQRGRPKIGNSVKVISLSVEQGLLARADRLAKKLKIGRAQLARRGLEAVLAGKTSAACCHLECEDLSSLWISLQRQTAVNAD